MNKTRTDPLPDFVGGSFVDTSRPDGLINDAIEALAQAFDETRRMSRVARIEVLDRTARALEEDGELPGFLAIESKLTVRDMELEVARSVSVFRFAAAELRSRGDETVAVDATAGGTDRLAMLRRVPYGPVLGITPFNGPILTASHKIAPAIAVGAPILIKPSRWVPRSAALLSRHVAASGWPAGAIASINASQAGTKQMVVDPRLPVVSFTGGPFGWELKSWAPRKHVHLELGGVGTVVIYEDAPLEYAASRVVTGAFVRSGQSCLSVQAVLVHVDRYDEFVRLLAERVRGLRAGDPLDASANVGPLRTEGDAERVTTLIRASVEAGGTVAVGGGADGDMCQPTLVVDCALDSPLLHQEAFGPVVAVAPFRNHAEVSDYMRGLPFGLHVGVFTRDIERAFTAFDEFPAGAVIVNDVNTWRVDNIPYGGVGESGFGREGVRYAMEEMTQTKLLVINREPFAR